MRIVGNFGEAKAAFYGDVAPPASRLLRMGINLFLLGSLVEGEAWRHYPVVDSPEMPRSPTPPEQLQQELAPLLAEHTDI